MITLVLARHAKSDWGDPGTDDHDRPLNARGERDAPDMGRRLAASGVRVRRILSSTALRARATAEAYSRALGVSVDLRDDLYGAPARTLFDAAATSGDTAVMIVAHDPGIGALAGALSDGAITHMPTAGIAVFTWKTDDWDEAIAVDPDSWTFDRPSG